MKIHNNTGKGNSKANYKKRHGNKESSGTRVQNKHQNNNLQEIHQKDFAALEERIHPSLDLPWKEGPHVLTCLTTQLYPPNSQLSTKQRCELQNHGNFNVHCHLLRQAKGSERESTRQFINTKMTSTFKNSLIWNLACNLDHKTGSLRIWSIRLFVLGTFWRRCFFFIGHVFDITFLHMQDKILNALASKQSR